MQAGAASPVVLTAANIPDSDALACKLAALIGRPIGKPLLDAISSIVTAHMRSAGRPFVEVGFPPQDVTDGTLRIVITQCRVGRIAVDGNRWTPAQAIAARSGLAPGSTIDQPALAKAMAGLAQPRLRSR